MAFLTAIAGAISTALFAGSALATTIIGSVLTFAARTALSYITRKRRPKQTAIQGQVQFGGDIPSTILFGTRNTKGHRIFYAKYGAGNKFNSDVFWLADGWNDGLEPFVYIYAEKHDLIAQTPIGNEHARYTIDGFSDAIIIRFYDGRPGQLADSELIAATSGLENKWLATDTCDNQAYAVVSREYRSDLFSKGRPEIEFILRGLREYDPGKDDTVAGGAGAHRLNDRSTWEHSRNPAIHRLNFLLGHKGLVSGEVLVGVGKSINEIDLSSHMLSANVSDTTRTVGGRTIPTYQCDMWVSADEDHLQVLEDIEDAMAGSAVNRASLDGVVAGAPQVPVLTLTRADIRTDEPESWKFRQSSTNSFNSLSGQFTSIESGYRPESLKVVTSAEDIAQDGKKRAAGNDLLQITDPDIAQYVQTIRYRQNRKAKRRSVPVSRRIGLKVLLEEWVVFDGITYALKRIKIDKLFRFSWELVETGSDIYGEGGIAPGPIIPPTISPSNPSLISTVAGFGVSAGLIEGPDGSQMPALQFVWTDPEDPTITAIRIEYRKTGTTEPIFHAASNDPTSEKLLVSSGVMSTTTYDARATISTVPDRLKTYTSWFTIATATTSLQILLSELGADVMERFEDIDTEIITTNSDLAQEVADRAAAVASEAADRLELSQVHSDRIRSTRDDLIALATEIVDMGANADLDRQIIRTSITSGINDVTAAYQEAITVATGPSSALVVAQTNLAAQIGEVESSISDTNTAFANADTAIALQTTTLETQVRGSYTGSDYTLAGGMIGQINSSVTSQFESVNTAIASISAGVDEQFDFFIIYNFDATISDWSGNGTPTWVSGGGWLRPANHATDPYVFSPTGLAVDLDTYGQVRVRVRRTGTPTWEGWIWWRLTGDTTWDSSRRIAVTEPTFDSGYSVFSKDLGVTGELDRIRLDLSSDQDDTNYFEIDWVAVGRPSPGASVASVNTINVALSNAISSEASSRQALSTALTGVVDPTTLALGDLSSGLLYQERIARSSTDSSLQSSITTLEGTVNDPLTGVAATGAAVEALDVRVTNNTDGISTVSSALTALSGEVDGKASTAALEELETSINADNLGKFSVHATSLRSLEATLLADAMEAVEVGTGANIGTENLAKATAAAREDTYTRIDETDASLASIAGRVTTMEAGLPEKANATYVQSIDTRVTETEAGVTANASAITAVEAQAANATAGGLFKIEAEAGSGSVLARIVMYVRAELEDDFEEAGSIYEVYDDGGTIKSRILMNADQFVITDGSNESLPLVFEGGELKLQVAHIGSAILDSLLQTSTGKLKIGDFGGGSEGLEVYT